MDSLKIQSKVVEEVSKQTNKKDRLACFFFFFESQRVAMVELNISVTVNDTSFRKNCKQKLMQGKKGKKKESLKRMLQVDIGNLNFFSLDTEEENV